LPDPRNPPGRAGPRFQIVLWLALGVVPLAVAPGLFVAHDLTPKLLVLYAAACLCLAWISAWYPGMVILARSRVGRVYLWAAGLQGISLLVSTLRSPRLGLSFAGTSWRRYGLATQLAVLLVGLACSGYFARHPGRVRNSLLPLLIVGCAAACLGIAQYFGYDPLFDPSLYTSTYHQILRPPATLGHAMYFAAYLLPGIFVAIALGAETRSPGLRAILIAGIVTAVVAIVLSGTRSAILGLLAGGLVFALRYRVRVARRTALLAGAAATVLVLSFAALAFTAAGHSFRERLAMWEGDALGGPRLGTWRDSLDLLRRHPVLGSGPETFAQEFRAVESPALARAYPDYYQESPHNLLFETGLAQGGLGLLALALLCGAALCGGWIAGSTFRSLSAGLLGALVSILVALQFMPLTVADALCLYCIAGMLVALGCADSREVASYRIRFARPLAAVGIPALAAVGLLFVMQDWAFARAGDAIRKGDLAAAAADYRAWRLFPLPWPGQDLWLSRQFAAAAVRDKPRAALALQLAAEASHRAERNSEEPFNAYYQSAALAIAAGDAPGGENKLRAAIRLAPAWYRPRLLLAESLLMRGRTQEGTAQAGAAMDLAGPRREDVQRTVDNLLVALRHQDPPPGE